MKVTGDSFIIHKLKYQNIINCRLLFESGRSAFDEKLARNPQYPPHLRCIIPFATQGKSDTITAEG